ARGGAYGLLPRPGGPSGAGAGAAARGKDKPLRVFTVAPTGTPTWIEAGMTHLDPGVYTAAVLLPTGSVLEWLELAPPCVNPIEPRGGWQAPAVATTEDVAVTVLQAIDQEAELPPAAPPIELHGSDFQLEDAQTVVAASSTERGPVPGGSEGTPRLLVPPPS